MLISFKLINNYNDTCHYDISSNMYDLQNTWSLSVYHLTPTDAITLH